MKNSEIHAFHIGRGGRHFNAGHLSYLGKKNINDFTEDLFLMFENHVKINKGLEPEQRDELTDFVSECKFDEMTEKFGITLQDLGAEMWHDGGGCSTGLPYENDGTGRIDIDGEYNTTYCKRYEDLDERELNLINE